MFEPRYVGSLRKIPLLAGLRWLVLTAWLPCCSADQDPEALRLMQLGEDRQNEDWARFHQMTGKGTLEWVSVSGEQHWACDMEFQVDGRERFWMLLKTTLNEAQGLRLYDKIEMVGDGTTIAAVTFAKRYRPSGCRTVIYEDDRSGLFLAGGILRFDPRTMVIPHMLSKDARLNKHYRQPDADIEMDPKIKNAVIVRGEYAYTRLEFSEELGFRLVRVSCYGHAQEFAAFIHDYVYQRTENGIEPVECVLKKASGRVGHSTFRIRFDSLERRTTRDSYNLASLNPCSGSRVIDRRENAETPVRSMANTSVESMPDASIDEQVEILPSRYRPKNAAPPDAVPPSRMSRFAFWLIVANGVVIGGAAIRWYLKQRP